MFAVTERLLLRPGWAEDAPALARAIGEEGIARNLARVPYPYSLADAEAFLALPQAPRRATFLIVLRDRPDQLVGGIGVHGDVAAELGYWIATPHQGRGYATEAGRAVVALAEMSLRLPRLVASHALDNPASGRVLAKLGFRPTGRIARLPSLARGGEMDVCLFARGGEEHADQALAA
jgi:RimJ/RimL family protein N-acetyltransferase